MNGFSRIVIATALIAGLAGCTRTEAPPPIVVLLSVDTLRADQLGAYGARPSRTPRLDALAAESLVFERAFAPAPFTRPAVASMLTGREPARIGVVSNVSPLPKDVPTVASMFAARGFATGAVVSNPVLRSGSGFARDFDHYDDAMLETEVVRGIPERGAAATTKAAFGVLDQLLAAPASGHFLWVHYQDPHGPYTPPDGYRERHLAAERARPDAQRTLSMSPGESGRGGIPNYQRVGDQRTPAFYRAGYAGEVEHVDEGIGQLLDGLRERGLFERAFIVVVADHGEGLGENDYWFAHGENLSEALVRVPLVVRVPGGPTGRRVDVVSLVDLAATLSEHFALARPDGDARPGGRALLARGAADGTSEVFVSTLAYVTPAAFGMAAGDFRYLIEPQGDGTREQLFRIGAPGEDVAAREPEVFARLRALTRQRVRELSAAPERAPQSLSEAERRALRALGYVEE